MGKPKSVRTMQLFQKARTQCMFPSRCKKLLPKMGNIFQEISNKPLYVPTEVGGWVKSKPARAYRVGGLVKKCADCERA